MAEDFVTVATFNRSFEAQMAKNLLESEGITSIVSGEITADMLPMGQSGGKDQIALQVNVDDAQRAAVILAEVAAAKIDADWEDQAESGAGVWICSICGEPISNRLSMCYSCQTPREGIRGTLPRDPAGIQPDLRTWPTNEQVQKRDEISDSHTTTLSNSESLSVPRGKEADIEEPVLSPGDDLARRAFISSVFGFVFLPLSWYFLAKLFFSDHDLSPKGSRYLYVALILNILFLVGSFAIYSGFYR